MNGLNKQGTVFRYDVKGRPISVIGSYGLRNKKIWKSL